MAIAANTAGEGGLPFAKFMKPGDTLIGSFGGGVRRQMRKYQSDELLTKDNGKPRMEEVMYLVAMPGTTAVTGDIENDPTPIAPGDNVRYAVSGFKWGQVIDARKALPAYAGVGVGAEASGDVVTITMTGWSAATENPAGATAAGLRVVDGRIVMTTDEEHERWALAQLRAGKPANAAKEYAVQVRRPRPDEASWEAQGDALYSSKPWERKEAAVVGGPGPFDAPVGANDLF